MLTDSGGLSAVGTFKVTKPTISIQPSSGYMGTTVTVTGKGWVPGSRGSVSIGGGSSPVTATPDSNGSFTARIEIPASVGVGPGTVQFTASDNLGNTAVPQDFTVKPAAISVDPGSGPVGTKVTVTTLLPCNYTKHW